MDKRILVLASTLMVGIGFAGKAEARCQPGQVQVGPLCVKAPDASPVRDHRCPASQGGNCVGPEPVVPPPPPPPQPTPPKHPLPPPVINQPPVMTEPDPVSPPQTGDAITCGEGRLIVKHSGFRHVEPIDCDPPLFKYTARKHGHRVLVRVKDDGQIVGVVPIGN